MALVTLNGVIVASEVNNNFIDHLSATNAGVLLGNKDYQYDQEILDLTNVLGVGLRTYDFTPPDDLEVRVMGVTAVSASANPVVTVTLTAIDSQEATASVYTLDTTPTVTVTAVVGTAHATRYDRQASSTAKLFLKKGVTYRMQVSSNSATVVDHVHAYLYCRTRRRRK